MKRKTEYIDLSGIDKCELLNVNILHGDSQKFSDCIYKVILNKARGGKTSLFGRVINDRSPMTLNKISIINGDELLLSFNYNEMREFNFYKLDSITVYKIIID